MAEQAALKQQLEDYVAEPLLAAALPSPVSALITSLAWMATPAFCVRGRA